MSPALPCLIALLCAPAAAWAQEDSTPPPEASPARAAHRLSVYFTTGLTAYLSDVRTMGGIGGGIGIRDTVDERFIFQADLSHLVMNGNVTALSVGAGVQRRGLYTPAVLLTASALFGDRLAFLTPEHPTPVRGPAVSVGAVLAPLRFTLGQTQASLLQVGVGVSSELPGLGLAYHLGIAEVGISF